MTDLNTLLIRSANRFYGADGITTSNPGKVDYGKADGYLSAAEIQATKGRVQATFDKWMDANQFKMGRSGIAREHNRVTRLLNTLDQAVPKAQAAETAGLPGLPYMADEFYALVKEHNLSNDAIRIAIEADGDLDGRVTFKEADTFTWYVGENLWDVDRYYPEAARTSLLDALRPAGGSKLHKVSHTHAGKTLDVNQSPARQTMRGLRFPGDSAQPEQSARAALKHFGDRVFGKNDIAPELGLLETKQGAASSHSRFQQSVDGIPVHGAYVTVHQGPDGDVQTIHSNYVQSPRVTDAPPSIDEAAAKQAAFAKAEVKEAVESKAELVWYPMGGTRMVLAWNVEFYSNEPTGQFSTVVDASTGKIIEHENLIAFRTGKGHSFYPNPVQLQGGTQGLSDNGDQPSDKLRSLMSEVELKGLDDDTKLLKGKYVDLATLNSPSKPDVDAEADENGNYFYDRNDPRFEQVVIYHTVDTIQRYFHELGFDDDTGAKNGIRDFPTQANAHWDNADNSFYRPWTDTIHFGDGGVDDGEDAEVVAHEYGHAVQHNQNKLFRGGETRAMGEGFGDYLAATVFFKMGDGDFQKQHAAAVAEWDATSYSRDNPPNLRRIDGNKIYPDDLRGQEHADGEIWSRVLWDIRKALGGTDADRLILEHHFSLPANATMTDAAKELLQADKNLYGGKNDAALRAIFADRGVLKPEN